jgi:hypothetical protein
MLLVPRTNLNTLKCLNQSVILNPRVYEPTKQRTYSPKASFSSKLFQLVVSILISCRKNVWSSNYLYAYVFTQIIIASDIVSAWHHRCLFYAELLSIRGASRFKPQQRNQHRSHTHLRLVRTRTIDPMSSSWSLHTVFQLRRSRLPSISSSASENGFHFIETAPNSSIENTTVVQSQIDCQWISIDHF